MVLRKEFNAKSITNCYVAVYYASEAGNRKKSCEYDRLNAITFSTIDLTKNKEA